MAVNENTVAFLKTMYNNVKEDAERDIGDIVEKRMREKIQCLIDINAVTQDDLTAFGDSIKLTFKVNTLRKKSTTPPASDPCGGIGVSRGDRPPPC